MVARASTLATRYPTKEVAAAAGPAVVLEDADAYAIVFIVVAMVMRETDPTA